MVHFVTRCRFFFFFFFFLLWVGLLDQVQAQRVIAGTELVSLVAVGANLAAPTASSGATRQAASG
jgi:hypothetical protein